jgi:hypothetical protein
MLQRPVVKPAPPKLKPALSQQFIPVSSASKPITVRKIGAALFSRHL